MIKHHSWGRRDLSDAERAAYRDALPSGEWIGVVEHVHYGKRTPGIHLYLQHAATKERYWTFIYWGGGTDLYQLVKDELIEGDWVEVKVEAGRRAKSLARVKSMKIINRSRIGSIAP